ncbi:MAG: fibronectin type III domain-containing protein, partial [Verrucomicrobia bacterium]|nr:fibronectin type III domain-containing protein [Verrucomicrobiota bacterium]
MTKNTTHSSWLARAMAVLSACLACWMARAEEATIAWDPPSDAAGVVGYRLHFGTATRAYSISTNVGSATSFVVRNLSPGVRYYFAATSLNSAGTESLYSTEISYFVLERLPEIPALASAYVTQNVPSAEIPIELSPGMSNGWTLTARSANTAVIADNGLSLGGANFSRTLVITPETGALGQSVITLELTNGERTNTASFRAFVSLPNLAPVVSAGTNATILTNATFMLRGRVTDDGLPLVPGGVSSSWAKVSGPGTVTFGNSNFVVTTARFSSAGIYRLRLTSTDGELTATADTVIRVHVAVDFTPPVISDYVVTEVTDTTVTLAWLTNEMADEQVQYTEDLGDTRNTLLNPVPRLDHTVVVTGLNPSTTYTFVAKSRDTTYNRTNSDPITLSTLFTAAASMAVAQSSP